MLPDTDEVNAEIRTAFYVDDEGNIFIHTKFVNYTIAMSILQGQSDAESLLAVASTLLSLDVMAARAMLLHTADSVVKGAEKIVSDIPPQNESLF
jgi:hypothetical protein